MQKATLKLFLGSLLVTAVWTGEALAATPASPTGLTQDEMAQLRAVEAQAPELAALSGGGCRDIWDNEEQRTKTVCYNPWRTGVMMGLAGGIVGSLGGVAGAAGGAAVGFGIGYVLGAQGD